MIRLRLIEKECPNCGAGLSFTKEDTSCKCEYCKREFEIERDTAQEKLTDQFVLSELKTPFKIFTYFVFGNIITSIIVGIIIFIIIVVIAFNIIKVIGNSGSVFNENEALITTSNELSSSDYSTLDLESKVLISKENIGITGNYTNNGSIKREKLYIISKNNSNFVIPIYKVVYKNIMNSDDTHTIYIPIKYKNVKKKNSFISFSLTDGEIVDTEYHFNDSDYSYGYNNLDVLYEEVIKPYEKTYKIVEK